MKIPAMILVPHERKTIHPGLRGVHAADRGVKPVA